MVLWRQHDNCWSFNTRICVINHCKFFLLTLKFLLTNKNEKKKINNIISCHFIYSTLELHYITIQIWSGGMSCARLMSKRLRRMMREQNCLANESKLCWMINFKIINSVSGLMKFLQIFKLKVDQQEIFELFCEKFVLCHRKPYIRNYQHAKHINSFIQIRLK